MISKQNILEFQSRREIYQFILQNPGLHEREISRRMKIPKTTLRYHLKYLEKQNLVTTNPGEGYSRYYITNKIGRQDKEILNLLRQEVPRNILMYMMFGYACSEIELSKELIKHSTTIAFHLKKLLEKDIIKAVPVEKGRIILPKGVILRRRSHKETIYIFKDMGLFYTLYDLLIVYKDSIPDQKLLAYFLNENKDHLSKRKRSPYNQVSAPGDSIDNVVELLFELFPHPYHV